MAARSPIKTFALSKFIYAVVFVIGALAFAYPLVTSMVNLQTQTRVISNYEQARAALDEEEKNRLLYEAEEYNRFVANLEGNVTDEMTKEEQAATDVVYMSVLSTGEAIGSVEIPKIEVELPIYRGASDEVLERGIGHLERSSLPVGGESTHSVLTGHRGLPSSRLFRDLDKLQIGDVFVIDSLEGKLAYEVESVVSVLPYEIESLRIQEGRDLCTLVTCDPYMINSHRLLVTGHRIDYVPSVIEEASQHKISFFEKYIEYFAIVGFFALVALIVWLLQKRAMRKRAALSKGGSHSGGGDVG